MTVARPEVGCGPTFIDRHSGQTGVGGWNHVRQGTQRWIRKTPSAPLLQKWTVSSLTAGKG